MPPYTPVASKSQSRALFARARSGELPISEAIGKTRAAKNKALPERVRRKGRKRSR